MTSSRREDEGRRQKSKQSRRDPLGTDLVKNVTTDVLSLKGGEKKEDTNTTSGTGKQI